MIHIDSVTKPTSWKWRYFLKMNHDFYRWNGKEDVIYKTVYDSKFQWGYLKWDLLRLLRMDFMLSPNYNFQRGAIAFDGTASGPSESAGSQPSVTVTHTAAGSNRLAVGMGGCQTADRMSSITYDGTAMTSYAAKNTVTGSTEEMYLNALIAPSTTSSANVVLNSSPNDVLVFGCVSYNGVSQTGLPDNSGTYLSAGNEVSSTLSITSVADNCWMLICSMTSDKQGQGAGTGSTRRGTADIVTMFDSNSAKTPAGSISMTVTQSAAKCRILGITFAPSGGGGGGTTSSRVRMLTGIGS